MATTAEASGDDSTIQRALNAARDILAGAGLALDDARVRDLLAQPLDLFSPLLAPTSSTSTEPSATGASTAPNIAIHDYILAALQQRHYEPVQATPFTPADISSKAHRITKQSYAQALIEHPYGATVEFPETGAGPGQSIAHRFRVDPSRPYLPHNAFQYSLGGKHNKHDSVGCHLIVPGQVVPCKVLKYQCNGLRACEFTGVDTPHSFTSPHREAGQRSDANDERARHAQNAEREVFLKTLALYKAIQQQGCRVADCTDYTEDTDGEDALFPRDVRSTIRRTCRGKILLKRDRFGQSFLECEHRQPGHCAHLLLRSLQDFDVDYLEALLKNDQTAIRVYEERAAALGCGPLVPCSSTRSCRTQNQLCPNTHRFEDGSLRPGQMCATECGAEFRIYIPHDLDATPYVLVVCTNEHAHRAPERSKTPPVFEHAFGSLLRGMDWRLADVTPRRLSQDSGFILALRQCLSWSSSHDPVFSDIHPSLGNLDRVAYFIDKIRAPLFPVGTDFEGARTILEEHEKLPRDQRYVRRVEEVLLPGETKKARFVICMSPRQSKDLLDSPRPTLDVAFARVKNWLEFEMEAWDVATSQSITLCRAFITSQTAAAYEHLFRLLYEVAYEDTGRHPRFRHLHGNGYEVWTGDEHKGQALGLGQFLVYLARLLHVPDPHEPDKQLSDLTPYDHLARFFRLCIVHYKRNIREMNNVSDDVRAAMYSLATCEKHADFDGALSIIRAGGKKARDWLRDKEVGAPFALPALYQPLSKIPLAIWRAAKSSSNGVEQKHRDVNRDGVGLTMLGGIHRALQHDVREERHGALATTHDIHPRFQLRDHDHRVKLKMTRVARGIRQNVGRTDDAVLASAARAEVMQRAVQNAAASVQQVATNGDHTQLPAAVKRLRESEADLYGESSTLRTLQQRGSGRIPLATIPAPQSLHGLVIPPELEPDVAPPSKRMKAVPRPRKIIPPALTTAPSPFHAPGPAYPSMPSLPLNPLDATSTLFPPQLTLNPSFGSSPVVYPPFIPHLPPPPHGSVVARPSTYTEDSSSSQLLPFPEDPFPSFMHM